MGATHVTVTIRNPAEPDRTWEALFLVRDARKIVARHADGPGVERCSRAGCKERAVWAFLR